MLLGKPASAVAAEMERDEIVQVKDEDEEEEAAPSHLTASEVNCRSADDHNQGDAHFGWSLPSFHC